MQTFTLTFSFYDQAGNGRQLLAVWLLADEKSAGSVRGGFSADGAWTRDVWPKSGEEFTA